jgi:hypothetical protein
VCAYNTNNNIITNSDIDVSYNSNNIILYNKYDNII